MSSIREKLFYETKESTDIKKKNEVKKKERTLHANIIVRELICRVLSSTTERENYK